MNKYATALITVILSGLVGGWAGYFLGRSSVPATAPSIPSVAVAVPGQEVLPGSSFQNQDPEKPQKLVPLTAATLCAEFASMESSGGGAMYFKKHADLQERLKASDLPAIAAEMCSGTSPGGREPALFLVLQAYTEFDPQAAWNLAIGIKQPGMRLNALQAVISSIAAKDPTRALALADSLAEPQFKMQVRSIAISTLAEKDPQRSLELLIASPPTRDTDMSFFRIFHHWVRKDPEAAKAAVARLSGHLAEQARRALVLELVNQDPQAAWTYASSLSASSSGNAYSDPRVQVIQNWGQSDPQAALEAALTIGESAQRSLAVSRAVEAWAETDFSAALNYATSTEDPVIRSDILQNLSENPNIDPKALLQAVMEHVPAGETFQRAVAGVFSSWARQNPAAAAAAALELPAGQTFSRVTTQIASQWMASTTNKQEVFDWVRKLPAGEARSNSMQSVFSTWSGEDPQAAARALSNLTAEDRKKALQSVASGWARNSPDAALKWSSSLTDPEERANAVRSVLSEWVNTSPAAAAKYVDAMPESERASVMQTVVSSWASKDSESAAAWLDKQPAGPSKDGALRSLSRQIAKEDPEAALTWVAGITDEKDRMRQTESIARDWIRQDPNTAKAWISTSKLPENIRNNLLK